VALPLATAVATAFGVVVDADLANLIPPVATPAAQVRATIAALVVEPLPHRPPPPPVLNPRVVTKVPATAVPPTGLARLPTGTPRPAVTTPQPATRAASTPTPASAPVVRETFDAPERGVLPRDTRQPDLYRHDYERGEFVLRIADSTARPSTLVAVPGEFAHTTLSVDARLVGETAGRFVALGCRAYGNAEYRLTLAAAGQFALDRFDGGRPVSLVAWRAAPPLPAGASAHRLALRCAGSQFTATINGVQVASVRDTTYTTGALWLGTGRFTNGPPGTVEARFDNLVVVREPDP
jgi:hypothetical protein